MPWGGKGDRLVVMTEAVLSFAQHLLHPGNLECVTDRLPLQFGGRFVEPFAQKGRQRLPLFFCAPGIQILEDRREDLVGLVAPSQAVPSASRRRRVRDRPRCRFASMRPTDVPRIPAIIAARTSDAATTCTRFRLTNFLSR